MIRTTMGKLLVNEALPEDMRDEARVLDKKGMNQLLRQLAEKHPDKYVEVSKRLNDIGRTVATEFGGYTFGLEHLRTSQVARKNRGEIQQKMRAILGNEKLTPEQRKAAIVKVVGGYQQKQIDDIYDEAVKANNPLALQVVSGSRGNKMNLGSLLGGDMLYSDHRDEVIPLPVLSSYSEGLKPMEYWASTYGARRGTMATKFATQDAGFLSKQLNQVAHRLMIVGEDDERDIPDRGLPVDTDDGDNEGALLAKDIGPYKRNTVLTPKILKHLKGQGHDRILVRSPLVGGSPDGGIYSRDVGVRERGVLPGRGEQVGLTAAQALSEPLSQGQLSAKHSGGVAGQEKAVGGFAYINQLIQVPKKFKGGATHSEYDGTVSSIEEAPAGGSYVWVGDKRHYVPAGIQLKVKKGDSVEAGDVITEGFPNPAIVTEHKGVGEGKRYFVNAFRQAMTDAGMKCNRRNVEILARGLINHVKLTDEMGDHVPDDVIPYSTMEHLYQPREGHQLTTPDKAVGQFLERPVLHYSIGTKVRPSVLKELAHFGVKEVAVHKDPPPFQANMIRGMYSLQNDPDWMTRMYGSGLKSSLLDATHHGAVSDEKGTSFVPSLARAVDFGRNGGPVRQPEPGTKLPPEGQPFGDIRAKPQLKTVPQTVPQPDKKPKQQGFFSSMFKMSADDIAREAEMLLKEAQNPSAPKVDTTTPSNTGSSTAAPTTTTTNPMAGTPPPAPGAAPPPAVPGAPPTPPAPATPPTGPNPAGPPIPPGPPGGPTTPAAPGTVHPGRMQPGMISENPWAGGIAGPDRTPVQQANPDAFGEGFTPGEGIFTQMDDPGMAADFVSGGGDPNQPGSGFGGQFGEVSRFGSLLDSRAVGALTSGQNYVKNPYESDGTHDSLIGGGEPQAIHGGMNWGGLLDRPPAPTAAPMANPTPAGPAGRAGNAVPMPMGSVSPTMGMQNPNFIRDDVARRAGWQAGNPMFDAAKKAMPNAPDHEIHQRLFNMQKRSLLFTRMGYTPGQPKFEEQRKKLNDQVLAQIGGNVDNAIRDMEQLVAQFTANDPNNPQKAEAENQLRMLKEFKEKGIQDGDVMDHIMTTMDPEGEISDYQMLQEMRGDNSPTMMALKAYGSPVTGTFAARLTGKVAKPVLGGLHAGLTRTPLVNRVPGFRPPVRPPVPTPGGLPGGTTAAKQGEKVVAKQVLKEGEEAAAKLAIKNAEKMGFKAIAKKVPYVGIVIEVIDVANTTPDELRAKFNDKMNMEATPGNIGWYFLDNALNPGQNIASAVTVYGDAMEMFRQAEKDSIGADGRQYAWAEALTARLRRVAQTRPLDEHEQDILNRNEAAMTRLRDTYSGAITSSGKDQERQYREKIINTRHHAYANLLDARLRIGQQSADKVFAGTATPSEREAFEMWRDAMIRGGMHAEGNIAPEAPVFRVPQGATREQRDELTRDYRTAQAEHRAWGGNTILGGPYSFGDRSYTNQLLTLAVRYGEAGNKEMADKLMAAYQAKSARDRIQQDAHNRIEAEKRKREEEERQRNTPEGRAAAERATQQFMQQQTQRWDEAFRKGWITQDGGYTEKYYNENPFVPKPAWMQPTTPGGTGTGGTGGTGGTSGTPSLFPYLPGGTGSNTGIPSLLPSAGGYSGMFGQPTGMGRRPGSEWGGSAVPYDFSNPLGGFGGTNNGTTNNGGFTFPGLTPPPGGIGGFGSPGGLYRPGSILPLLPRGRDDDIPNLDF